MNKKKVLAIGICFSLIIVSIIGVIIFQKTRLTYQEMSTLNCVQDVKHMSKDKQNFKLDDDILILNYTADVDGTKKFYKFSYIKYKENNESKCAIYDFEEYIGEYDEEINPYDIDYDNESEVERIVKLSYAKTAYAEYSIGELDSNLIHFVKKNRIKRKVK